MTTGRIPFTNRNQSEENTMRAIATATARAIVVLLAAIGVAALVACDDDNHDDGPGRVGEVMVIVEGAQYPDRTFTFCLEGESLPDDPWCVTSATPWTGRTVGDRGAEVTLSATFPDGIDSSCVWVLYGPQRDGDRFCPRGGAIKTTFALGGGRP